MGKGPEETLPQRGHTDGNRQMKRCSMSLINREMQITTMRYHLIPVRMAIINQQTSASKVVGKGEPFCTVGGNADWWQPQWKVVWS